MRSYLLAMVPLALAAAPAAAQAARTIEIPPELTDPEFVDRITAMTESLSDAFLNLPVGELEAAVEGRPATREDRRRTVRDVGRISERDLRQQMEQARPQMRAAMQALVRALPAMSKALGEAADEMERATSNLPQPGYPRR